MKKVVFFIICLVCMWVIAALGLLLWPLSLLRGMQTFRSTWTAIDQLGNAFWFQGHHDETISSHAGRWITEHGERVPGWVKIVVALTEPIEQKHVLKSIEPDHISRPLSHR